jgi:lysozyme
MTDQRKPIFDAVRAAGGRFPDAATVSLLDGILTRLGVPKDTMRGSPVAERFIKGFEQCRLKAFLPTPDDVPTIGWGRTKGVKLGMTQTQAEADADFAADLAERAEFISDKLGGAPTTQAQFDAMLSLAYNIGLDGFAGSTVLRKHKAGDYAGAAAAFAMWNKQAGKELAGLTRRRAAEAAMYKGLSS